MTCRCRPGVFRVAGCCPPDHRDLLPAYDRVPDDHPATGTVWAGQAEELRADLRQSPGWRQERVLAAEERGYVPEGKWRR